MFSIKKQKMLEDVLPPAKLLYLFDASLSETANDIATAIGGIFAKFQSASPHYMRETGIVWARYKEEGLKHEADPFVPQDVVDNPVDFGGIRACYIAKEYAMVRKVVCPPPPIAYCKGLERLLFKVSSTTSFGRTGDNLVHHSILASIPLPMAASLSTLEVPYHLAGKVFGGDANRRVRKLFERNVEADFSATNWGSDNSAESFVLAAMLLLETGGDLNTRVAAAKDFACAKELETPSLFLWRDKRPGIIYRNRVLHADDGAHYPVFSLLLHFLEIVAAVDVEGGAEAARSILCAVKTPSRVRSRSASSFSFPTSAYSAAPTDPRPRQPLYNYPQRRTGRSGRWVRHGRVGPRIPAPRAQT